MTHTLLLNATYEAICPVTWQRAITLLTQGKVEVVAEYEDREVRSVKFAIKIPSVVRLLRYAHIKRREHVPFTRANIYARDHYTCQYCDEQFRSEDLTFDHVIPASQGGTKCWENIVTACVDCNRRKDNRTPEEADMPLKRHPHRPTSLAVLTVTLKLRKAPDNWRSFLYWNAELES